MAKPWHRRRALWIFRDQTGLSVTPKLWTSIQTALDNSEYFVLMASPEAAQSPWVNREIEHWVATKPLDRVLPVVTDGEWRWDPELKDFDPDSTSVPPALRGVFAEEPLYLDLRWARDDRHLSLRHSRFRDAIAQLAAPMHGVSKDDLEGEDVRQHRRASRLRLSAVASLLLLTMLAIGTGLSAVENATRANASAVEALRQQKEASAQRGHAERYAGEAQKQQDAARANEAEAQEAAAEAKRQRETAQAQAALAEKAKGDVKIQLAKADEAAKRAKEQQALAARQTTLAKESAAEARRQQERAKEQEALAKKQEKLAAEAGAEAAEQKKVAADQTKLALDAKKLAEQQQKIAQEQEQRAKVAGEEAARQQKLAISRRLVNEAKATIDDDPRLAFKLGAAAHKINPSGEITRDVAGLVTSTRRYGALDDVYRTAYGPGGLLVTVAPGGVATLWDLTAPAKPVQRATINDAARDPGVALSPDGKTLALVWDLGGAIYDVSVPAKPKRIATLPGDRYYSTAEFSPDGRILATGDRPTADGVEQRPGYATLWDVTEPADPSELSVLDGGKDFGAYDFAFSGDGKTLVVAHGAAVVFDITDPRNPVQRSQIESYNVSYGLALSPVAPKLAIGGLNGTVTLYDLTDTAAPEQVHQLHSGDDSNLALDFSSDGARLAGGFYDGRTVVWDVAGDHPAEATRVQGRVGVTSLGFSPDDSMLVSVEQLETAVIWSMDDFAAPKQRAEAKGHDRSVLKARYVDGGRSMVSISMDATAVRWDVSGPGAPKQLNKIGPFRELIHEAAISPDGKTIAISNDGLILLIDTTDWAEPKPFASLRPGSSSVYELEFSPDGKRLVMGTGREIQLWDVSNHNDLKKLFTLPVGEFGVAEVAFRPDGEVLAIADEKKINLWSLTEPTKPQRLSTLTGHAGIVLAMSFAPNGRYLVSGGTDRTGIVWDVSEPADPQRLAGLTGQVSDVTSINFSADGRTVVAGEETQWATLWDVEQPARPVRLSRIERDHGSGSGEGAIAFSPDGTTLAVGTAYRKAGNIGLWDLTELNRLRTDPAVFGCAIAGTGFTKAEWTRLIPELQWEQTCTG